MGRAIFLLSVFGIFISVACHTSAFPTPTPITSSKVVVTQWATIPQVLSSPLVLSPNVGAEVRRGDILMIRWVPYKYKESVKIRVSLYQNKRIVLGNVFQTGVGYSIEVPDEPGSYEWKVPTVLKGGEYEIELAPFPGPGNSRFDWEKSYTRISIVIR
ncbi:MAG: hypothetical protein HYW97_00520 [Candidatus Wildermuthbacteria bacterium]|nr:hypothetical protein [Candidatus Wildermuthbacteria bacterium]